MLPCSYRKGYIAFSIFCKFCPYMRNQMGETIIHDATENENGSNNENDDDS